MFEFFEQIRPFVEDQLKNNEFFSGGLLVVVLSSSLAYMRKTPMRLFNFCKMLTRTTMVLNNFGEERYAYQCMLQWLSQNEKILSRNRTISPERHVKFGFGSSWFFVGWRLCRVVRSKTESDTGTLKKRENLDISLWGRNSKMLFDMVEKAKAFDKTLCEDEPVRMYKSSTSGDWRYVGNLKTRTLESVVLAEGKLGKMVKRIELFKDREQRYHDLGIPHQLGILLEGPPGTGKTSSVLALASHFEARVYVISLTGLTDCALADLMSEFDDDGVNFVIIEDVDASLTSTVAPRGGEPKSDGPKDPAAGAKVTLSGLLNAINGINSSSRVLFMTTNHVEQLDPALIRPGRVDMKMRIDVMNDEQVERMCARFGLDPERVEYATKAYSGRPACDIQEYLIETCING